MRDKSRNVAWLAILSFGESWHNLHHSDPTCARHGVLKGQIDTSARLIWVLEKLQLASDVRWPDAARLTAKQTGSAGRKLVATAKAGIGVRVDKVGDQVEQLRHVLASDLDAILDDPQPEPPATSPFDPGRR